MMDRIKAFLADDDGAVTVDFVVLTAAICLMGSVVVMAFSGGTLTLGNDIAEFMTEDASEYLKSAGN